MHQQPTIPSGGTNPNIGDDDIFPLKQMLLICGSITSPLSEQFASEVGMQLDGQDLSQYFFELGRSMVREAFAKNKPSAIVGSEKQRSTLFGSRALS